jgi:hypothetical protein
MSQPAGAATRTATPAPTSQAPTSLAPPRADAKRTVPTDDTGSTPDGDPSKRNVRAVGPTFIPPR